MFNKTKYVRQYVTLRPSSFSKYTNTIIVDGRELGTVREHDVWTRKEFTARIEKVTEKTVSTLDQAVDWLMCQ